MNSPDPLRQRVALALSEIFVISMAGLPVQWPGMAAAAYMDMLEAHAFGNVRSFARKRDIVLRDGCVPQTCAAT